MGERTNVKLVYEGYEDKPIYLYSHWGGGGMRENLRTALQEGRNRWDDNQYLGRILVSQIVGDHWDSEVGYGLAPFPGEEECQTLTVYLGFSKDFRGVDAGYGKVSYEEFVNGRV